MIGRAGRPCARTGWPRMPAHDTERRAIGWAAAAASRRHEKPAKRRPSPLGDGRFNN
ncbi:hypothetical protein OH687_25295 [Burkholderia anthina]|nr:hypothetical protein OH687_25295 [Burkholderia anthina]